MSAEKGSSRADTLIKVVLVFFISLLSFSVGTFVGKQVSDSDHRRMALEGELNTTRQTASTAPTTQTGDKITDKEVEKLTQEFVNKEKSGDEQAVAKADQTAPAQAAPDQQTQPQADQAANTDDSGYQTYKRGTTANPAAAATTAATEKPTTPLANEDGTSKVANKVAAGQAPTDGEPTPRKPASILPSVASSAIGKYTVQVAAYPAEKQALDHAARLKNKGWNAFYLPATVHGHTWYRVLVGLFTTPKSAKLFRTKFMKEAKARSAIVQRIVQ